MDSSQKHSKTKTIWLLVILFLFASSNTVWGLFALQINNQREQEMKSASSLAAQKLSLESKLKAVEATKSEVPKESSATDTSWRQIPELGVKFKVTEANKDLTYSYDTFKEGSVTVDAVLLSTTKLIQASEKDDTGRSLCSSNNGPAGAITKYKAGTILPVAGTVVDEIKDAVKIGDYYLVFQKSQSLCSDKVSGDQTAAATASYATFKTFQQID